MKDGVSQEDKEDDTLNVTYYYHHLPGLSQTLTQVTALPGTSVSSVIILPYLVQQRIDEI